ncbi:MAG: quinone-dependent dihydroorotate dehydrogenase [Bacteroidales bacterium]|nr:quinone-dependent dihydroorotate dehydrogenase [Bacteroidales bacterium]
MYKLFRNILFLWQPEKIHDFTVSTLKFLDKIPIIPPIVRLFCNYRNPVLEREVFGVKFRNPVGLAAGFDKNGDAFNAIANFGFGFVEIGSLTPNPQDGNPKPRCFRLIKDQAIVNRMGINNKGVKHAISYIQKHRNSCPIGCSITKGRDTSMADAYKDYELSFEYMYDYVDYFVLNVSCPNVKDASSNQSLENITPIIDKLLELRIMYDDYRPILLKISPDVERDYLDDVINLVLISGLDGIIAANTTAKRENLRSSKSAISRAGNGGLSGKPLYDRTLELVKYIRHKTNGHLPIIASGGVMTPQQALELLDNGASLVQIYTGWIYKGPRFIRKVNKFIAKTLIERKLQAEQENASQNA